MVMDEVKKEMEEHPEWNMDDAYLSRVLYRLGLKETDCVQDGIHQLIDGYQILFLDQWQKDHADLLGSVQLVRLYERVAGMEEFVTLGEKNSMMADISVFFGIGTSRSWNNCDQSKYQEYIVLEQECEMIVSNYNLSKWYREANPDTGMEIDRQYRKWRQDFHMRLLALASTEHKKTKRKRKVK